MFALLGDEAEQGALVCLLLFREELKNAILPHGGPLPFPTASKFSPLITVLSLQETCDRGSTIIGTKTRTSGFGCPQEFFRRIGIAKRPEVALQNRIRDGEVIASKHVEMLVC